MGSSRRAVISLLGLALVGGAGGLGCDDLPPSPEAGRNGQPAPPNVTVHLENFVVNLSDAEGGKFLRIGIDLGLDSLPASHAAIPTARVRDTILAVLTTWRSEALLAPDGKLKLKEELVRGLRERVPELHVREVYFTEFLVQR